MTADARPQYSVAELMGKMAMPAGLLDGGAATSLAGEVTSAPVVSRARARSSRASSAAAATIGLAPEETSPTQRVVGATAAAGGEDNRARGRSVRIDRSVEVMLAVSSGVTGRSFTDLALAAVEDHYLQVESLGGPAQATAGGGLFPRRVQKPVAPNRVLISLYLTDDELATLDGIAVGAGLTRSELVNRCAAAELTKRVFCPVEALLRLQATGEPQEAFRAWIEEVGAAGVPGPALPGKPEGWTELAGEWVEGARDALDRVQAIIRASSWTEVAWAAFSRSKVPSSATGDSSGG